MVADLVWRHSLAHRIHCMWYGDLTHDGLSELTIVTTGGVHILQVSLTFSTTELKYFCKMGNFSCEIVLFLFLCSTTLAKPGGWCQRDWCTLWDGKTAN